MTTTQFTCPTPSLPSPNNPTFSNWNTTGTGWSIANGNLIHSAQSAWADYAIYQGPVPGCAYSLTNFQMDAYLTVTYANNNNAGMLFRSGANGDGYVGVMQPPNTVVLGYFAAGIYHFMSVSDARTINSAQAYHMRVVVIGSSISLYVTDMVTPVIQAIDTRSTAGQIGVRGYNTAAYYGVQVAQATATAP